MKLRFLSICLFTVIVCQLVYSTEYPLPTTGAKWGQLYFEAVHVFPSAYHYNYYGRNLSPKSKDTTINEKVYTCWDGFFTRYDNGRIYVIDTVEGLFRSELEPVNGVKYTVLDELVLYDFNLKVGDSILFPYALPLDNYFHVSKKEIYTVNGQSRRRLSLHGTLPRWSSDVELDWIEGIGDVKFGLFYHFCKYYYRNPQFRDDMPLTLVCFSDSSGEVYNAEVPAYFENLSCSTVDGYYLPYKATGIDGGGSSTISMYPTPVHDFVSIDANGTILQSEIYTLEGFRIMEGTDTIDCSKLLPGLYLLRVSLSDGSISTIPFVKE